MVGVAWGRRCLSGQCDGLCMQVSLGHWALGLCRPLQGQNPGPSPWHPGLAPRARSHSAGSPELSQTPPRIQGTSPGRWPRAASSSSRGWTALKRAGILPAILENSACWLSGQGTAGLSWEPRLQPPTAQAPMPSPTPSTDHSSFEVGAGSSPRPACVLLGPRPVPRLQCYVRPCKPVHEGTTQSSDHAAFALSP